ncbi:flavin reductase (NADPH) [Aricia agestis]|uniref:flavin reductase (NADPH) n=1 Tax=Aricia agestis TaxID=91739 RepID=UPI001C20A8A6|nr:flavin reductase (NADPH) [Aricia agestis]XP_041970016.1 flavin reductase (NADPH) [Aricia agestis]
MNKIVIFGATGVTGLCAVQAALAKGLEVRAFVRDPSKLPDEIKSKVEVFKGDVLEPDSVNYAVEGTDGVVIALGTSGNLDPTSDLSEGTRNILDSMKSKRVNTVAACTSAFLFYEPDKVPPRFIPITKDHQRMAEAIKETGFNYVLVYPPHISDDPSRDIIVEVNPEKSPGRSISKHDLGKFLVDALSEPKYYKKVIGLCNVPQQ